MNFREIASWKKVLLADLEYVSSEFMEKIDEHSVVILTGKAGSGKTTFISSLFPDLKIQSPTYSIINEYFNFAHADFYRIEDTDEIFNLELELYLDGKDYFFVEWGKDYLRTISKLIDPDWQIYELIINSNEIDSSVSSRNYILSKFIS